MIGKPKKFTVCTVEAQSAAQTISARAINPDSQTTAKPTGAGAVNDLLGD